MRTKIFAGALFLAWSSFCFTGCQKEEMNGTGSGNVAVRMTDMPQPTQRNVDHVGVEILSVRVHMKDGKWLELPTRSGIYDLVEVSRGNDTLIVDPTRLPAQEIDRLQLVLGSHNSVTIDGIKYPLHFSGDRVILVKMPGNIQVPGNTVTTRTLLLDFDAQHSIKQVNDTVYHFDPVIRLVN